MFATKESIYTHLPKPVVHVEKPPLYASKFRPTVILERKLNKDAMKTMGPPKVEVQSKQQQKNNKDAKDLKLLKKNQHLREASKPCTVKKPAVPRRTDNHVTASTSKQNFVKKNVAEQVKPRANHINKNIHEKSGLVPKYVKKKSYGKVPEYVLQRIEDRRAQEESATRAKQLKEESANKQLSEEERQTTLNGLKRNWDKLHAEFQGLPFVQDTPSRKAKRAKIDKEMDQLEHYIKLIEGPKKISFTK
ncbi:enkurin-like [Aulostomus maculatus]